MNEHMRRGAGLWALVALAPVLAGCAGADAPSRDEVEERYRIEIASALGVDPSAALDDEASTMAEAALQGLCGDDSFRDSLAALEDAQRAWDAGCLVHFQDDMTEGQISRALANAGG